MNILSGMTKWIAGWKKKGWVTAAKEPVKNKEDLMELDEAMQKIKVEWVNICKTWVITNKWQRNCVDKYAKG